VNRSVVPDVESLFPTYTAFAGTPRDFVQ